MEQTPVHQIHNAEVLGIMPTNARRVVEIGCSSGALAREYKKVNPGVFYTGVEIVPEYAEMARAHCDRVMVMNIEDASPEILAGDLRADCWVFADVLEHLYDPWKVLKNIRASLVQGDCVVTCIPNAQHWSVQARLSVGDFRYQNMGLFDRTHIRWFTRVTMLEMFTEAGYVVEHAIARVFEEPHRDTFLPVIHEMALAAGADPKAAVQDSIPFQYVLRAVAA